MKKNTILIILFVTNVYCQNITRLYPILSNSPTFSMGKSAPILETPDGGYLLNYSYSYPNWDGFPGYITTIIKTNNNFIPIWSKNTGIGMGNGKKTIVLNDGTYLIYFDSGTLLKLDANGQTIFSIGNFTTYPHRLNIADVELIGSTIKVIGTKDTYNGFGYITASTQVMIDFDYNGNILQTYVLNSGGTSLWNRPTNICKDNFGNYYISGYSYADGQYISKFDSNNTVIWSRRFTNSTSINEIITLSNGDLLLAGKMGSVFLCKLSATTGIPLTAKAGSNYSSSINSISELANGDLIATGLLKENDTSIERTFSMKMNSNADFSWLKLYNYGFGISTPLIKGINNWYYTAFHNNYSNNNYPILFNTENTGITSCPYTDISLNLIPFVLDSTPNNMIISTNSTMWTTPTTTTNFYPTETQSYVDECLSLTTNEIDKTSYLTVFPNPSKGDINIVSESIIKSINVTNSLGQKVNDYFPNAFETKLSFDSNGLYIVRIETEKEIKTTKIIISN